MKYDIMPNKFFFFEAMHDDDEFWVIYSLLIIDDFHNDLFTIYGLSIYTMMKVAFENDARLLYAN